MAVDTIPFLLPSTQRATGTGDRRAVNVISEIVKTELTKEAFFNVRKRPGLLNSTQPPGVAATGRGLYGWGATSTIYSVFDNKIWSGVTDLGVTLAASSGRVWFTETPSTASAQLLIVSDGTDDYNITTGDVATQIDEVDDAQFPTTNQGPVEFYSSYLFHANGDQVVNSDLNSFVAWTAGAAFSASDRGDALEAIHLQDAYLMAMGRRSIQFLYDNGNPTGSPLLAHDQAIREMGLAAKETLAWKGPITMFVAETGGGRSVVLMQNLSGKEVSDSVINRFLNAEGASLSSATAWMGWCAGSLLYVLNLSSADRSFIYNVSAGVWEGEWEDANGGNKFNGAYATELNGTTYVQDATNGRIYTFPATTFQDSGVTLSVTLTTEGRDQGTRNRKFVPEVELVGDTQSSGTATLSASDNDFSSFTTIGTFDLTQERKVITRCGSYVGKRAWRITHAQNTAFRAQALRVSYQAGT